MKAIIISNGTIEDTNTLVNEIRKNDYSICADGGAKYFSDMSIYPDVIVGDFDSVDKKDLNQMKANGIKFYEFPVKKDKTDTELAIDYAIEMGAKEITLMGVIGTRMDHTLANIMLLKKLINQGIKGKIVNKYNEVYITKDELTLKRKQDTFVSIIPLTEIAKGVTLKGFEYETDKEDFKMDSSYGVSNRIISETGKVKIDEGICLVIISRD